MIELDPPALTPAINVEQDLGILQYGLMRLPGYQYDEPDLTEARRAQTSLPGVGKPVDGAATSKMWDFDEVKTATATQRLAFWDGFESRRQNTTSAASTSLENYTMSTNSGTSTCEFLADAVTGRTYFQIRNGTAAAVLAYLVGINLGMRPAENWSFKALVSRTTAPVGGTVDVYAGFRKDALTGQSDGIYFRQTNAGNWFLVARSAGVESTLDMGVAPTTTLILLEFRAVNDGTRIEGYYNGTYIGAIVTNIPTALIVAGTGGAIFMVDNRAGVITTGISTNLYGWGWKSDAVS